MKEVCHFIYEWGLFKDGSIFISLNNCFTIEDYINEFAELIGIPANDQNKFDSAW